MPAAPSTKKEASKAMTDPTEKRQGFVILNDNDTTVFAHRSEAKTNKVKSWTGTERNNS
jgi:hypothetical protein